MSEPFAPLSPGVYRIDIGPWFYIGSAAQGLNKRRNRHVWELRTGRHINPRLQRAYNRYGEFNFTVLEQTSADEVLEREQHYLDQHFDDPACVNMLPTAGNARGTTRSAAWRKAASDRMLGKSPSPEARAKISAALSGRTLTPEHRAAISAGSKGRKQDPEAIARAAAARKGFRHSEQAKEKMRAAALGRGHAAETRKKIGDTQRGRNVYSDMQIALAVAAFVEASRLVGSRPTRAAYTSVRSAVPGLPSAALVEGRLGAWSLARERAVRDCGEAAAKTLRSAPPAAIDVLMRLVLTEGPKATSS